MQQMNQKKCLCLWRHFLDLNSAVRRQVLKSEHFGLFWKLFAWFVSRCLSFSSLFCHIKVDIIFHSSTDTNYLSEIRIWHYSNCVLMVSHLMWLLRSFWCFVVSEDGFTTFQLHGKLTMVHKGILHGGRFFRGFKCGASHYSVILTYLQVFKAYFCRSTHSTIVAW